MNRDDPASCPLCSESSRRRFERHGFWIRDCDRCAHRFAELLPTTEHVESTYDDDYFRGGGAGYRDYVADAELLRERGAWYGRMLGPRLPAGRLLDVGAAAGFWLAGMTDHGWSGRGIEPNVAMATHARERLGLDVMPGTLEDALLNEEFDLIAMIQVVAHFVDVRRALETAARLTRDEGYWLIETWDRASWTARILGRSWHEYSPPSVLHWFSADGLAGAATRCGFSEIARGRPRKRIRGRHAKSLLRHGFGESALGRLASGALNVIPDGLTLPYPTDDLFWMLLRKQPGG